MIQKYFAHSVDSRPVDEWQPLDEHLLNVAELTRGHLQKSSGGEEGAYLGKES